ncbi:MAG: hypothetical protein R3B82_00485 [Sandaracinaceae bacterium]
MRYALSFLVVLWAAAPAAAQGLSARDREVARGHFDRGTLAFDRGDYADAAAEFRAAYALTHHADLLYNIYSAQERNGELEEAAEALEGYLEGGDLDEPRREALELRLERLRLRIEQERLQAAEHEAEAQREREAAEERLAAEQSEREAAEARASEERTRRMDQLRAGHGTSDALDVTGVVAMGAGALGLVSFGVFAGLSTSEDGSLASTCGRDAGRICRPADTEDLATYNTGADASLIAGASLVVVGGVLVLVGESLRPSDRVDVAVLPVLAPGYVGLTAGGRL